MLIVLLAPQVVAQALGLALSIGFVVAAGVQLAGPRVLVRLAGEKSKEVRQQQRRVGVYLATLVLAIYSVPVWRTAFQIPAPSKQSSNLLHSCHLNSHIF